MLAFHLSEERLLEAISKPGVARFSEPLNAHLAFLRKQADWSFIQLDAKKALKLPAALLEAEPLADRLTAALEQTVAYSQWEERQAASKSVRVYYALTCNEERWAKELESVAPEVWSRHGKPYLQMIRDGYRAQVDPASRAAVDLCLDEALATFRLERRHNILCGVIEISDKLEQRMKRLGLSAKPF